MSINSCRLGSVLCAVNLTVCDMWLTLYKLRGVGTPLKMSRICRVRISSLSDQAFYLPFSGVFSISVSSALKCQFAKLLCAREQGMVLVFLVHSWCFVACSYSLMSENCIGRRTLKIQ